MMFRVAMLIAVCGGLLSAPLLAAEQAGSRTSTTSSLQRTIAPQASGAAHDKVRSQMDGQPMRSAVQPATAAPAKPSWWSKLGDSSKNAWTKTKSVFTPNAEQATKKESRFTMVGQIDEPKATTTKQKTSWWQFGKPSAKKK